MAQAVSQTVSLPGTGDKMPVVAYGTWTVWQVCVRPRGPTKQTNKQTNKGTNEQQTYNNDGYDIDDDDNTTTTKPPPSPLPPPLPPPPPPPPTTTTTTRRN